MKQPYLQFYTGDHLRDPGVRSVSLAARGLWSDLLCLMHQSSRRGFLQHPNGVPYSDAQLARMVGHSLEEIAPLLHELDDAGVYSRTEDGVIYSRRMDRDDRKRQLCSVAGKKGGGNPALGAPPLKVPFKGISENRLNPITEVRDSKGRRQTVPEAIASSSAAPAADTRETVPCAEVFDLFDAKCPSLPQLKDRSEQRREAIRARWKAARKAQPDQDPRAWFIELFTAVEESDFISGRSGRATFGFDWILKPANAQKILEGNYSNARPAAARTWGMHGKPPEQRDYSETKF